ncbi:cellulase family glycosylhydrolase [Symbioplanes lichenis]|uniref:cellulase family glycosylhydrolase n=1 Tax=Symbioplanes lichenis TaxID=1629072 RepID=UPI002739E45A|nr:cellulase family glycosylhydrolase [Actinoplanes lichenis]
MTARVLRYGMALAAMMGCMVPGATAAHAATKATTAQLKARNLATTAVTKQINYYPAAAGWSAMWSNWQPAQINADLARAAALGATSVRVIVFPDTFGWPAPTATYTDRLAKFFALAATNKLAVKLTLFDWWGRYDEVAKSTQWATALLTPYRNDSRLISVELKNEMNPDSAAEMSWARQMIPVLRKVLPATPVTVTTPGSKAIDGFRKLKAALATTPPDYYDYHYYGDSASAYAELSEAKSIAAPATLVLGEAGRSSLFFNEGEQAAYLGRVFAAARQAGIPSVAPWTLFDFTSTAGPSSDTPAAEYAYGLYRTDGTAKPAAAVVKNYWAGKPLDDSLLNLGFENGIGAWLNSSPEFGTATWTATGARTGTGAIAFSGTTRSANALPSLKISPITPVRGGQTWKAQVYARGAAATGLTQLSLAWFDAAGAYLGQNSSAALPAGDTAWTLLQTSGVAPAGAASVQMHLKSGDNTGTVWFDDAGLALSAG